ncbi:hypothetical protein HK102_009733, partial [Quaeritorhiza haematococci]
AREAREREVEVREQLERVERELEEERRRKEEEGEIRVRRAVRDAEERLRDEYERRMKEMEEEFGRRVEEERRRAEEDVLKQVTAAKERLGQGAGAVGVEVAVQCEKGLGMPLKEDKALQYDDDTCVSSTVAPSPSTSASSPCTGTCTCPSSSTTLKSAPATSTSSTPDDTTTIRVRKSDLLNFMLAARKVEGMKRELETLRDEKRQWVREKERVERRERFSVLRMPLLP